MARKIMFEATQPVVNGNEILHAAGDLFAAEADVPDYVLTHPVIVDVPDKPAEQAKAEKAPAQQPKK